jgi:4-hydroxy-2-oxoglutarate aldolase
MVAQQDPTGGTFVSAATLTEGGTGLAMAMPKSTIRTRSKSVGFQIVDGNTAWMLEGLRAGATGVAPALAACAPQACYEVLAAWKDGDEGLADEKQTRILNAAKWVETQLGVPGIKYGCDLNGYFGGVARLPWLPLTGVQRSEIDALMRGIRS